MPAAKAPDLNLEKLSLMGVVVVVPAEGWEFERGGEGGNVSASSKAFTAHSSGDEGSVAVVIHLFAEPTESGRLGHSPRILWGIAVSLHAKQSRRDLGMGVRGRGGAYHGSRNELVWPVDLIPHGAITSLECTISM